MSSPLAQFDAILSDSISAIKVSNQGFGRITFDVDESQLPELLKVLLGKDGLLHITVTAA